MTHATAKDSPQVLVTDWGSGRPVTLIQGRPVSAGSGDDDTMTMADVGHGWSATHDCRLANGLIDFLGR